MKYSELKEIARKFRNNPTPEEKLLWSYLRNDQINGLRFLRQHPIIYESVRNEHYFFIPDFYCSSAKLVIEVDGKVHDYQKDRDHHRDEILRAKGLRILRIKNEELKVIHKVLKKIRNVI
jgi:very-short-patch-repair endonuclease